jgi:nucleoside-diphosphate-sugar epimerase
MVAAAGGEAADALAVFGADLTEDDGWDDAVSGCDAVLRVASPFALQVPEHEDELIVPARDGTRRVLRAARDARVRRVVLTSAFAAIGYGRATAEHVLTEADWTDVNGDIAPYLKSKVVAERAAWDSWRTRATASSSACWPARTLVSEGAVADASYREAIERLSRTRIHIELARAHLLYGGWLRRTGQRIAARGSCAPRTSDSPTSAPRPSLSVPGASCRRRVSPFVG